MTIAPSGRRTALSWVRLGVFSLSAMLGGVTTFGLVASVGIVWAISGPASVALVVIALLWVSSWHATQMAFPPLPHRHGQVPREWSRSLHGVARFGGAMGLGVATKVSSGLVHFALVLTLLVGNLSTGIAAGVAFGLARSAPVFLAFIIPKYPKEPTSYLRLLTLYFPPPSRLAANLALLIASAGVAMSLMIPSA